MRTTNIKRVAVVNCYTYIWLLTVVVINFEIIKRIGEKLRRQVYGSKLDTFNNISYRYRVCFINNKVNLPNNEKTNSNKYSQPLFVLVDKLLVVKHNVFHKHSSFHTNDRGIRN